MTDNPEGRPPTPLAYVSASEQGDRFYGWASHRLFIRFAAVAAVNSLVAVCAGLADETRGLCVAGMVVCCVAYVVLWVTGQVAFWSYPDETARPFSAFALGGLVVLGLAGTFLYAMILL